MTSGAPGYRIGPALPEHVPALDAIERAAARLFPPDLLPPHLADRVVPEEMHRKAQADGRLWVALDGAGAPVGFAIAEARGRAAFLVEVDVHPDHARRGIGRALVEGVVAWARAQGFDAVTLTTYASPPWNAPWYERLGFRRVGGDELPAELARQLREEARDGLTDRVAMRLDLGGGGTAPTGRVAGTREAT